MVIPAEAIVCFTYRLVQEEPCSAALMTGFRDEMLAEAKTRNFGLDGFDDSPWRERYWLRLRLLNYIISHG
ncbi:hypothetical protein GOP47_0012844 [Adiantum capillus-veneris]|uniref:Uncharacterized protein n=1 Tax=Adiantum capillus-veneris TaxID=13818 RepID=A0A9D4USU7_ADICA|nr:hypothetical protein GOP47_0012844 [Adiantum capillus-veneris]